MFAFASDLGDEGVETVLDNVAERPASVESRWHGLILG